MANLNNVMTDLQVKEKILKISLNQVQIHKISFLLINLVLEIRFRYFHWIGIQNGHQLI
jgi:hypothetical protein